MGLSRSDLGGSVRDALDERGDSRGIFLLSLLREYQVSPLLPIWLVTKEEIKMEHSSSASHAVGNAEVISKALGSPVEYALIREGILGQYETTSGALPLPPFEVTSPIEIAARIELADWGTPAISGDCDHEYKWRGEAKKYGITGTTQTPCLKPVLFHCTKCPDFYLAVCNSKDAEYCEPCEARYRSRVRSVLRIPMMASRPGSVFLVTLTAPGSRRHCLTHVYKDKSGKEQPSVRCQWEEKADPQTGAVVSVPVNPECVECVCSENRVSTWGEIADFNQSLAKKWNRFMTYVRRYSPEAVNGRSNKASRPFQNFEYAKAIEPQKRGALHIHALIRTENPLAMTPDVLLAFREMAMNLGFGHQFDVQVVGDGKLDQVTAARYVAKYVSKRNSATDPEIPFRRTKTVLVKSPRRSSPVTSFGSASGHRMSGRAYTQVRNAEGGQMEGSHVTPDGEVVEAVYKAEEYSNYLSSYGPCLAPVEKKVKPPRAWTVSRNWGLSMGKIIRQQSLWQYDKEAGAKKMMEHIWTVFSHQMGILNPMKPLLAIEA